MTLYLLVASGGMIGALLRYGISQWQPHISTTLAINIFGSFLLGAFMAWQSQNPSISPALKALVSAGILGAFTTFSTFSMESFHLINKGLYAKAFCYVTASVILSIGAFALASTLFKN